MSTATTVTPGKENRISSVRFMAFVGMFSAIAAVLMFIEMPIPFIAPPFYKLDLSEVPVLVGTFALGPVGGIFIEIIKILIHLLIKGTSTAYVGELGNLVVGMALFLPAGLIYKKVKTRKGALIGLITGSVVMILAGSLMNAYVLLPMYAAAFGGMEGILAFGTEIHASVNSVASFVALCVAPFNLVKAIITSILTLLLYKRISVLIKGQH
ncbi:MAG: ECF transporter S component [Lachnospiraceae bacterium]|nr:ECF transporter S component [Lachnospiraceae bacterium]